MTRIILDEFTDRKDLTKFQKYKLRHPEKWNLIKSNNQRRKWSSLSEIERTSTHLRKRYKISYDEWINLFEEQNYKCKICENSVEASFGNSPNKGVVDHCHSSGKIRGILCHHCNRALGLIKDNLKTIDKMKEYLTGQR